MKKYVLLLLLCVGLSFSESLWKGERAGLFDDHNAKLVGDSITIIVVEKISSSQKSGNTIGNSNKISVGAGTGFADFLAEKTSLPSETSFQASGEQSSEGELKTEVTVRVKEVLPNGELFVKGAKKTNLNGEQQVIEISGIVRPENIMEGNKVYSTYLADAKIDYKLEGEMRNVVEPGWLTKAFNMVF